MYKRTKMSWDYSTRFFTDMDGCLTLLNITSKPYTKSNISSIHISLGIKLRWSMGITRANNCHNDTNYFSFVHKSVIAHLLICSLLFCQCSRIIGPIREPWNQFVAALLLVLSSRPQARKLYEHENCTVALYVSKDSILPLKSTVFLLNIKIHSKLSSEK